LNKANKKTHYYYTQPFILPKGPAQAKQQNRENRVIFIVLLLS